MLQQSNNLNKKTKLRLIEINTIAVGLGAAAKLMHQWHKYRIYRIMFFFYRKNKFVFFIDDF